MIEPRFDEFKSAAEKAESLSEMKMAEISLQPFREALGSTPLLAAGGFGPDNLEEGIRDGSHDLVAFGRYFMYVELLAFTNELRSNPDLVERLKSGEPLYKWDRSRFYGPFLDNEVGYTVFPNREYASKNDRLKGQLVD